MKRKIKCITSVLCALSLMLAGTSSIFADNIEPPELTETVQEAEQHETADTEVSAVSESVIASGICGDNLTWEIDESGTLTISGSGELYDYKFTSDVPWNKYVNNIRGVTLNIDTPSLCSEAGNCAFGMLTNIPEIVIPEGVTAIPESESFFPYDLKKLILPSTYTGNLSDNSLIKDLVYTAIEVLEDNPVYSSIDGTLFNKDKTKLIQYTQSAVKPNYIIPDTVIDIDNAFSGASYLESLTISKNVEIVNKATYVGDFSEKGMGRDGMYSTCKAVYVDDDNPYFCSVDGVLYNRDMTMLIWSPPYRQGNEFNIPETVEIIAPGALGNSKYQSIHIPDSITTLGAFAFSRIKAGSITIPESIENIYTGCFLSSQNLSKVYIENCNAEFSARVFEGCRNLKTAGLAGSGCNIEFSWTDKIPDNVFYNCSYLTSIKIPDTITSIGNSAFKGCSSLKTIEIPSSITVIADDAFVECRTMTNIYVDNLKGIIAGNNWSAPKAKVTYSREIQIEELPEYRYSGEAYKPLISINEVKADGTVIKQLLDGTDYTVEYCDNINAGTATAAIEYINSYSKLPSREAHFTILPKSCLDLAIMPITDQAYTGREIMPDLTITNN